MMVLALEASEASLSEEQAAFLSATLAKISVRLVCAACFCFAFFLLLLSCFFCSRFMLFFFKALADSAEALVGHAR